MLVRGGVDRARSEMIIGWLVAKAKGYLTKLKYLISQLVGTCCLEHQWL